MAESPRTVTYEVQVPRDSRWEIRARFDEKDRHVALTGARTMTRHPHVPMVREVKDIYDAEQDGTEELVIYKSRPSARLSDVIAAKATSVPFPAAGQILVFEVVRSRFVADQPTELHGLRRFPAQGVRRPVPLYKPARI